MKVSDAFLVSQRKQKVGQLSSERILIAHNLHFHWMCIGTSVSPAPGILGLLDSWSFEVQLLSFSRNIWQWKTPKKTKADMSPAFYGLKKRGEHVCQKIIVAHIHTVTFTRLSTVLTLINQTKSSKLCLSGFISSLIFIYFPPWCYLRNYQGCISNTSVKGWYTYIERGLWYQREDSFTMTSSDNCKII